MAVHVWRLDKNGHDDGIGKHEDANSFTAKEGVLYVTRFNAGNHHGQAIYQNGFWTRAEKIED